MSDFDAAPKRGTHPACATPLPASEHDDDRDANAFDARLTSADSIRHLQKMDSIARLGRGMAHDFNNLMQGIVAGLELSRKLIAAGRGAESDRLTASAVGAARQAASLNQRLQGLSRPASGNRVALRMSDAIADLEDVLCAFLPQNSRLELDFAPGTWATHCVAHDAQIAVVNLVLSAFDAMPEGGTIAVRTRNVEAGEGPLAPVPGVGQRQGVCVDVTASGAHGESAAPKAPAAASAADLRVAMIRDFARRNGGVAIVEPDAGRGASFSLWLPRCVESGS